MPENKRIATWDWLNDNLGEFKKGTPPINKKGVNKEELISNYNVDEHLLVDYVYNRLVPREKCVGINTNFNLGIFKTNNSLNLDMYNNYYTIASSNTKSEKSDYYKFNSNKSNIIGRGFSSKINSNNELDVVIYHFENFDSFQNLSDGTKLMKIGNKIVWGDFNSISRELGVKGEIFVSPNKELSYLSFPEDNLYINHLSGTDDFSTFLKYQPKGYLFNSGRMLSTLKSKENYPIVNYDNQTHTVLCNANAYLVLENLESALKLTKWSEDLTNVPQEMLNKENFIKDLNINSNSFKVRFKPGHTSRAFFRNIDSLDFTNKILKIDFIKQLLSDANSETNITDTKIFIRLATSDIASNYAEYETYIENFQNLTVKDWKREMFSYQKASDAITQRDLKNYSKLQRFEFPALENDPNKNIYIKGDIDLTNINQIMVGIRSTSGNLTRDILLFTKDLSIYDEKINIKIDIRRSEIEVYNNNLHPHIVSNLEGEGLLYDLGIITPETDDELGEIMFKKTVLEDKTIDGLNKSFLVTSYSNTEEAFVRMEDSNEILLYKTNDLNKVINIGGDVQNSLILSNDKNLVFFKQNSNNPIDLDINGSNRKIIQLCFNV